jgi:hypothetical protein
MIRPRVKASPWSNLFSKSAHRWQKKVPDPSFIAISTSQSSQFGQSVFIVEIVPSIEKPRPELSTGYLSVAIFPTTVYLS